MKFHELLIAAIQRSEIPLRFEPGAEESVAKPVTELIQAWLQAHLPADTRTEFERGRLAAIDQLVDELTGAKDVPPA
jgi:hypothetical protein